MENRKTALNDWLKTIITTPFKLIPLNGDASFRQYYRLTQQSSQLIVMDAPPANESLADFIKINEIITTAGVRTPRVYHSNIPAGFAILEDLGNQLLLDNINATNADSYYKSAIDSIVSMQHCETSVPLFDRTLLMQELNLFSTWFIKGYLQFQLTGNEVCIIDNAFNQLCVEILKQPYCFVHRDYHSRNLMITDNKLVVIDFQDAVKGPITYDLVSLLKDCYITWPRDQVMDWLNYFYQNSTQAQTVSLAEFTRFFDLTGLQRHLKVLGIFCRLHLRDGKSNYLKSLQTTLNYTLDCLARYPDFDRFYQLISGIKLP